MSYFFEGWLLAAYIIIALIITAKATYKNEHPITRSICFAGFFIYLYFLIDLTQFPIYVSPSMADELGRNIFNSLNLIPFKDIFNMTGFYNIVATIPLGVLIPLITQRIWSFESIILIGICTGLLLEGLQLCQLFIIGYTLRIVDVNDVICNGLGVIIGYMIFRAGYTLLSSLANRALSNFIADYFVR